MTKKQLKDIVRCYKGEISCKECSNKVNRCRRGRVFNAGTSIKDSGCMGKAAQAALAYRDMLERLEYCGKDTPNGIIHEVCPICEHQEHEGHDKDCALGKLLKDGEE